MYVCMYVCMYVYTYICIYVYMYICIYVYMCLCIYIYKCIYVYMYICISICICICISISICIHRGYGSRPMELIMPFFPERSAQLHVAAEMGEVQLRISPTKMEEFRIKKQSIVTVIGFCNLLDFLAKPIGISTRNKHRVFRSASASGSIMFTLQKESDF